MKRIFNNKAEKEKRKHLRKNLPKPEITLWQKLKGQQLYGYKFRRQHSIGLFIVDFYCPLRHLAIEIDGESHFIDTERTYDMRRQNYIESLGVRFLRFTNVEINTNIDGVLVRIVEVLEKKIPPPPQTPPLAGGG